MNDFAGFVVALEIGREPALVANAGGILAVVQNLLQGVEGLGPVAKRLGEARRADRHDHELLEVHAVVGVLAAVEDVHHRHREPHRSGPAQVGIERKFGGPRRRPGDRHRHAQDRIGPELALCGRAVQVDHQAVDFGLTCRVQPEQLGRNRLIDVGDRLEHSLAAVPLLVAVAEFQGFVFTGRSPGRHGGRRGDAVVQSDMHADRRIPARIEDFQGTQRRDFPTHVFLLHVCEGVRLPVAVSVSGTLNTSACGERNKKAPVTSFAWELFKASAKNNSHRTGRPW